MRLDIAARVCDSPGKQAVLLGPVERQIEFGQTRRGDLDGLAALQHRFDERGAQKRQIDEAPNVAPAYSIAFRAAIGARPLASSSNHARPRAIALISAGSCFVLWFCDVKPGSTSLFSAPRRLNSTAAVNSMAVSVGVSEANNRTSLANSGARRILIDISSSAMMTFSTRSRTTIARFPGELLSIAASTVCTAKQFSYLLGGHVGGAEKLEQLAKVSSRIRITASSNSVAANRKPGARSVSDFEIRAAET